MQEINAKIVTKRIISSNIYIPQMLDKNLKLNMKCKAQMKTPKKEGDKSVLLNTELSVCTKDEKLKMDLVADIIFVLEKLPEDYNEIAEKKLVPMAQEVLLDSMDEMLVIMGYKKMELRKRINSNG